MLQIILFVLSASNLLNWSYQNTKACSVLVSESSDIFPASKATTLETNRSVSSRPRPASAAGTSPAGGRAESSNPLIPLHRSRRQALQHASPLDTTIEPLDLSLSPPIVELAVHDDQLVATSPPIIISHESLHTHDYSTATATSDQTPTSLFASTITTEETDYITSNSGVSFINETSTSNSSNNSLLSTQNPTHDVMLQDDHMAIITYDKVDTLSDKNMLKNDVPIEEHESNKKLIAPDSKLTRYPEEYLLLDNSLSGFRKNLKSVHGLKSAAEQKTVLSNNTNKAVSINRVDEKNSKHSPTDNVDHAVLAEKLSPDNNYENRLLVNLTISTERRGINQSKPLYMLSISVPTNESSGFLPDVKLTPIVDTEHGFDASDTPSESLQLASSERDVNAYKESFQSTEPPVTTTTISADKMWGGECICSCPLCPDNLNSDNITESFLDDYFEPDIDSDESVILNESEYTTISTTTTSTTTEKLTSEVDGSSTFTDSTTVSNMIDFESSSDTPTSTESDVATDEFSTETSCPVVTTPLPPPPTILILEGKINFILFILFGETFLNFWICRPYVKAWKRSFCTANHAVESITHFLLFLVKHIVQNWTFIIFILD